MEEIYCGIDLGTSSVKGATFNKKFQLLSKNKENYKLYSNKKNQAELDPEEVYQKTIKCLKFLQKKSSKDFEFISISSALHSLIAVDEEYNPLTGCLTWADTRAKEFKSSLKSLYEEHGLYQKTGCPPHAMYSPAKILWMQKYHPQSFSQTNKFITIKEYVLKKMTGKEYVDFSLASAGGLLNLKEKKWEPILLDHLNISLNQLGKLVDVNKIVEIKPNVQSAINTEAPVVVGSGDGPLANLGVGAYKNNDYVVTIGSSGAIRIFSDKPIFDDEMRTWCYMLDKYTYLPGGAINNGGIVLDWLKNKLFSTEVSDEKFYSELEDVLRKVPAGSEGVFFLPFLTGERSPNWNASSKGVIFGLSLEHDQKNIIKSAVEGILFRLYSVFKALKSINEEEADIIASGGFTGSEMWLQMLADLFGQKVIAYADYEASSAGAAMVGARALGNLNNFNEIRPCFEVETIKNVNLDAHKKYQELYYNHKEVYDYNSNMF